MMRSEILPSLGAQVQVRHTSTGVEDIEPANVVGALRDPVFGDVLVLRPLGSQKTIQRLWPSSAIDPSAA